MSDDLFKIAHGGLLQAVAELVAFYRTGGAPLSRLQTELFCESSFWSPEFAGTVIEAIIGKYYPRSRPKNTPMG